MRRFSIAAILMLLLFAVAAAGQTDYDTSPQAQTGEQIYGSYFGTDIDSVSLYNGNLNIRISLISLPGRELPYGLSLSYNSQKWELETCYDNSGNPLEQPCGLYTGGWRIQTAFGTGPSFSITYDTCANNQFGGQSPQYNVNAYWIDALGTKHRYLTKAWGSGTCASHLPPSTYLGLTLAATDSDGSTMYTGDNNDPSNPVRPYVSFKDGSILYLAPATNVASDLISVHGNKLTRPANAILPSQDTLGRSITFSTTYVGYSPWTDYYTVADSNGSNQTYALNWTEASVYDPHGGGLVTRTRVTSIVLPNGKSYGFEYNHQQGFLTKLTLPSGAYIKYVYPASPNDTNAAYDQILERRVSADGTTAAEKVWSYAGYTGLGTSSTARTVTVTSPVGHKVVHVYNAQGQETQTQWQTASSTTLKTVNTGWSQDSIESNGQATNSKVNTVTTILDGNAQSEHSLAYDTKMNVIQDKTKEWGSGAPGTLVKQIDRTYQTWTGTNLWRLTSETVTAIDPATNNFVQQGKTEYVFDEYSLTLRSGVPGHDGRTSAIGNVTTVKRYKDANNFVAEHVYYDNLGNVVQKVDPLNHATTIDFTDNFTDSVNRNTFAYPKTATNALNQFTTNKYDFNTGLAKQVINLRGYTATTAYDMLNRVTSVTEPNNKVISYSYDDTNRITTKTVTVDTSGNLGRVKTYFDGLYRVIQTRTNDPEGEIAVDTVYDGKGRKTQVTNPYRISGGTQIWTTTTYDALDRQTQVQAPDNSTEQYAYSNNVTTVTDEAGNQRRYTYDILGQMTKVEEPNPTLSTPLVTTYSYYAFGPQYQSNQSNQLRTFVNNWLGQMTSQTLPESGTTTFAYDAAGRMTAKTDARNIATTLSYDSINRLTTRSYSDGTPTVTIGYDASGYTGLKTSMVDGVGSVNYTYDTTNRLVQESRTLTGVTGTFTTGYGYNIKGDVTSMTYPSGRVVNFSYATGGGCCNSRLASVVDQTTGTTLDSAMNYNAAGERLNSTLGNGVVQTFAYNNRLQETSITASLTGTTLMSFAYDYGTSSTNTGRVLSRTDGIQPEHSVNYYYDSVYRLTQANAADSSWGISWTFDVWGNRLTQTPTGLATAKVGTQTSGYNNNRNTTFTYDFVGNQTNDGLHNYTFNAENQITQMDGGAATYAYDGDGRRMKKTVGSETTYTFYGPGGMISEFTTSNAISTATSATSTDKCFYHTTDKLGSAVLVMNSVGLVIENNRTLPYGEAWLAESTPTTNDKKVTTYQRDQESTLDYAIDRFYGNGQGRFTSADRGSPTLYMPRSLNRYTYVLDDPVNHTDAGGQTPEPPWPPPPPPIQVPGLSSYGGGLMSSWGIMAAAGIVIQQPTLSSVISQPQYQIDALRAMIKSGQIGDCEATARFSIFAASTADGNPIAAAVTMGALMNNPLRQGGAGVTDWKPSFVDSLDRNADQSHHFALFFLLGAYSAASNELLTNLLGYIAREAGAGVFEKAESILRGDPLDQGDIDLGNAAAQLGADLARGKLRPDQVADRIRNDFCDKK